MIYFIIGQPGAGKTTLGIKLHKLLTLEKRNWRRDVFHIDETQLRELYSIDYTEMGRTLNTTNAQAMAEFLQSNECDVVVSVVAPYREIRESFKEKLGSDIIEIYLHTLDIRGKEQYYVSDYEPPECNFIDIDTTKSKVDKSFSKLVNNLSRLGKL